MKVAICLSGSIRYPHLGLQSIKNIIPNDFVKIFIHTWRIADENEFLNTIHGLKYKEKDKILDTNCDLLDLYEYEKLLIEDYSSRKIEFEKILPQLLSQPPDHYNYIEPRTDVGQISMWYSVYKSNQLRVRYEKENNITFDRVIRMRYDSDFEGKILDLSKLSADICIPEGEDWLGGTNDQFALGSSSGMNIYSDFYIDMINLKIKSTYHSETMLSKYLHMKNVDVERFNFPVRINNNIDFRRVLYT